LAATDSESRRERILDVAIGLFYEHGYKATSVNAIARQVGLSGPALYWHFSSKQQLCFAAVERELARFVAGLRVALAEETPEERLQAFVRAYVLAKLRQSQRLSTPGATGSYGMLRDALAPDYQERLDALQRQAVELLRAILEEGRADGRFQLGHVTATAFAISMMCEYVFVWARPDGRFSDAMVAEIYSDLALAMVGVPTADTGVVLTKRPNER
jgi:AcrR family transcriptional regulator